MFNQNQIVLYNAYYFIIRIKIVHRSWIGYPRFTLTTTMELKGHETNSNKDPFKITKNMLNSFTLRLKIAIFAQPGASVVLKFLLDIKVVIYKLYNTTSDILL